MSLSVRSSARAGNPLGGGEDWGDSPYGSLITLGPRTFKKKPVLVLADEELAQAHLAMAMGGAEIMDMQPDPVAAPRPRQPAVMLGLVPMGVETPDEDVIAWTPPAPEEDDGWEPLPDYDEPEVEEAEVQTWVPEEEPEDFAPPFLSDEETAEADYFTPLQAAPEPQVPSIEEQLERMRERLAKRAAATAAQMPAEPVVEPVAEQRPTTIERLEIDDWTGSASLKGFIPPQERDLAPAPPQPATPPSAPAPAVPAREAAPPPVVTQPEPEPEPEPAPWHQPAPQPAPEPEVFYQPEPDPAAWMEPQPAAEPFEPDLSSALPDEDQAALDAWAEHLAPVAAPPRRHAGIRARLSDADDWHGLDDEPAPGLLAWLWAWLRGRF